MQDGAQDASDENVTNRSENVHADREHLKVYPVRMTVRYKEIYAQLHLDLLEFDERRDGEATAQRVSINKASEVMCAYPLTA